MPNPVGRPSKYSPAYCNEVIECLAEGHSVTGFAGQIGVDRTTVFEWATQHPEFSHAVKIGQAKATMFWENVLHHVAVTGKGNVVAVIFGLKNRAADDWADKVVNEHTGKNGSPLEMILKAIDGTDRSIPNRPQQLLIDAKVNGKGHPQE